VRDAPDHDAGVERSNRTEELVHGRWREAYPPRLLAHFDTAMGPLIQRHPWLLEDTD